MKTTVCLQRLNKYFLVLALKEECHASLVIIIVIEFNCIFNV